MNSIILNHKFISIYEDEHIYVSPYSFFMLENYCNINFKNKVVCDYGTGTGILALFASFNKIKELILIDNNLAALKLAKQNFFQNNPLVKDLNYYSELNDFKHIVDIILCNPASLPSFCSNHCFCNGGELGLDMIFSVLNFSNKYLSLDGSLYLIVTKILPYSLVEKEIDKNDLDYEIISEKRIAFREHYRQIPTWIQKLKPIYSEMQFHCENNSYFEDIMLWRVYKKKSYQI